jgi:hypothetical protein
MLRADPEEVVEHLKGLYHRLLAVDLRQDLLQTSEDLVEVGTHLAPSTVS